MRKNNLLITSSCLLGALASCYGACGKNPRPSANGIWAWETRQAGRIGMLLYQPLWVT